MQPQGKISSQSSAFSCHLGATHQHRVALGKGHSLQFGLQEQVKAEEQHREG